MKVKLNKKGKEIIKKFNLLSKLAGELNIEFEENSYGASVGTCLQSISDGNIEDDELMDFIEENDLKEYIK